MKTKCEIWKTRKYQKGLREKREDCAMRDIHEIASFESRSGAVELSEYFVSHRADET